MDFRFLYSIISFYVAFYSEEGIRFFSKAPFLFKSLFDVVHLENIRICDLMKLLGNPEEITLFFDDKLPTVLMVFRFHRLFQCFL